MHIAKSIGLVAAWILGVSTVTAAAQKPNVLVIYLDDMGWAEPGCYGGKRAPTPNMDAIAAAGARCTNGYVSACVCSPSRVGLMTGRYQVRSGHDANPGAGRGLALSETLMSQRFKELGYATAIIGKWHLGTFEPEYLPIRRGFDVSMGSTSNLGEGSGPHFYRGAEMMDDQPGAPVTTPFYTREACKFIDEHKDAPWFLYLPFNAVHGPIVATKGSIEQFKEIEDEKEREYAAMIWEVDDAIGKVMNKLRKLNLEENTLVFVISDNGGASPMATMGGLRGRKWLVWEGGIRVTWLVQWKGRIPGGQVIDAPVIQLDVLPTALVAAGAEVKKEWQLDGVNLLPLLERKVSKLSPRELYFRFGVQYAVRQGDWKLVKADIDMKPMLVNLANDPGEQNDLTSQERAKAKALQALYDKWDATMMPPRWDDERWKGEAAHRAAVGKKNERKKNERQEKAKAE